MTSRALLFAALAATGCTELSKAKVTIIFENETQTKCVRVSAKGPGGATEQGKPEAINRGMNDTLLIGIGQTADLTGEVQVTVKRFAAVDCVGTEFDSETKSVTLMQGAGGMLEFRFVGATDGGVDGGVDDGGSDAGCDTSMCPAPTDCHTGAPSCSCTYQLAMPGTTCSSGVCSATGQCVANACAVLADGMPCTSPLTCLTNTQCFSMACVGACTNTPPQCMEAVSTMCANATDCAVRPSATLENSTCDAGVANGFARCTTGACLPWFQTPPLNVKVTEHTVDYPDAGWVFASPDGGVCHTIISTSGTPSVVQGDCGTPPLFSTIDDAGVAVFVTLGLDVGTNTRVNFVGARPAQLLVIGNATVNGQIGAAAITGMPPAGVDPPSCSVVLPATNNKQGGGGGGFYALGGNGGEGGTTGGAPNFSNAVPLRGGCSGAPGFGSIDGGFGGGAFQLAVSGTLTMMGGAVSTSGGGGAAGRADGHGGGGGGSGGTTIVTALTMNLAGGAVTSNGGNAGQGGENTDPCESGAAGALNTAMRLPAANFGACSGGAGGQGGVGTSAGSNGSNGGGSSGGGGGGGAVGVIYVKALAGGTCTRGGGVTSGGDPISIDCN